MLKTLSRTNSDNKYQRTILQFELISVRTDNVELEVKAVKAVILELKDSFSIFQVIRNRDDSFNTFASGISCPDSPYSDISTFSDYKPNDVFFRDLTIPPQ